MVRFKPLLVAASLFAAVLARAGYNTQYTVDFDGPDSYEITNIMMYEEGPGTSSLTWPFRAVSPGHNVLYNPFSTDSPTQASLLLGITHDLPNDAPGQKHVVLFMDTYAAQLAEHIAWGTLFRNTLEENLISDIELATSGQDWNIIQPGLDHVFAFANGDAKTGILQPTGAPQSALFVPNGQFAVMSFSDGAILGYGTAETIQTTPEPASMAALGMGALALLRRRKKA